MEVSLGTLFENEVLQGLWQRAVVEDEMYQEIVEAVQQGDRKLPKAITHVQISEFTIGSGDGLLRFHDRIWIPSSEPLRTHLFTD